MTAALLVLVTLLVAYANGANDNFKGVATLLGSRTTGYRTAIAWATATTFAGALTAAILAEGLVDRFRGKGLVPDALTEHPGFLASVGLSAAVTVLLAALLGLPVSTTHALMGALAGAGLVAARGAVDLAVLASGFVLPLVVSPLLAGVLAGALHPLLRRSRVRLGIEHDSCLCAVAGIALLQPAGSSPGVLASPRLEFSTGTVHGCGERYGGSVLALRAQALLDAAHWLSAGTLSFARGLNDAPKIVALLVAFDALGLRPGLLLVAAAMAAGGLLNARRVAETMSNRVTGMNRGQGFTANLVASLLVLVASRFALPVSTTHVSCGALFGIGVASGGARWIAIRQILAAWVTTLPLSALLGAIAAGLLA